ncbi:hypothetical protein HDU83_003863 [Entophlyctis luteolus]|nr:hypothetical protein HDU83_003863 [Entophlyctis luteolus]
MERPWLWAALAAAAVLAATNPPPSSLAASSGRWVSWLSPKSYSNYFLFSLATIAVTGDIYLGALGAWVKLPFKSNDHLLNRLADSALFELFSLQESALPMNSVFARQATSALSAALNVFIVLQGFPTHFSARSLGSLHIQRGTRVGGLSGVVAGLRLFVIAINMQTIADFGGFGWYDIEDDMRYFVHRVVVETAIAYFWSEDFGAIVGGLVGGFLAACALGF